MTISLYGSVYLFKNSYRINLEVSKIFAFIIDIGVVRSVLSFGWWGSDSSIASL